MLSWLLTYFVHSTILLGIMAVVSRFLDSRHLPLEETLWRLAVVGGVVTASAQLALAVQPLAGTLALGASPFGATAEVAPLASFNTALPEGLRASTAAPSQLPFLYSVLDKWLVLGWVAGASLLTVTLIAAYLRLEGRLRNRRTIDSGPLMGMLTGLRAASETKRAVRLTSSQRIAVPLAKGWWRREICLPDRAVHQLSAEQQETILAHELAHLERRDPLWLTALHLLESVLFIQPLNRLARRRLQVIAEYRCDDWAVGRTGLPVTMARCLASVAEWNLHRDHPTPTPALAAKSQGLAKRVARLLDRGYLQAGSPRPAWLMPLAAVLLVLTILAAPGFSVAQPEAPQAPPEPVTEATPEPPEPPQPVAEPIAAVGPVPAVPAPTPAPPAPVRLPSQPSPVEMPSLELELEEAAQLVRSQRLEIQALRRELQAMREREQSLLQSELRELREEQQRLQSELQEQRKERQRVQREELRHSEELRQRQRDRMRDLEAPEDPPS